MFESSFFFREIKNHITVPWGLQKEKLFAPPTVAGIFLTKKCNSRCKICEYWKENYFDDELSTQAWLNVIDQLQKMGTKIINFTADGEILTRKDAFTIMMHAKKQGLQISVNTNGISIDRYIDQLICLNPMQIQISLDAFDDKLYESIRGIPKGFSRVKKNILKLKAKRFKRISIGSVLTIDNLNALSQLQNFCIENGFTYRVTAFQFQGFNVDNRPLIQSYRKKEFIDQLRSTIDTLCQKPMNNTTMYLKAIENYFLHEKFHPLNCIVGYYKIFILPNGDVSLCNMMRTHAIIGNVLHGEPLDELWKNDLAKKVRNNIKQKKCPSCWLSCFAEDNIRFSSRHMLKQMPYFVKKTFRLLR